MWHLKGPTIEALATAAARVLSSTEEDLTILSSTQNEFTAKVTVSPGRRTITLLKSSGKTGVGVQEDSSNRERGSPLRVMDANANENVAVAQAATLLHKCSDQASFSVSTALEGLFQTPPGYLSSAHALGTYSVARLLHYAPGGQAPAHSDGSGYTLLFTDSSNIEVLCPETGNWHHVRPPESKKECILVLGRYLTSSYGTNSSFPAAPIHRVGPAGDNGRSALAISINADQAWPTIPDKNSTSPSAVATRSHCTRSMLIENSILEAEALSCQYLETFVPSEDTIRAHWRLLCAIVEGELGIVCSQNASNGAPYRLPDVHCTGYWQRQTLRYFEFLRVHALYPEEAKGCLPPRQIHHVWLCHMLQPEEYKADCLDLLGRTLEHTNHSWDLCGCLTFHKLWQRVTGKSWPEEHQLREEVDEAFTMSVLPGAPEKRGIRADFWKGYDGLAEIMDSVICHAPSLVVDPKNGSNPSLHETRHDYARYLIASTYAPNLNLAPGCAIDLVWHAHQTEPQSYHQTMNALPRFINHNPCGKLNPPCIEWAHGTTKVWEDLYGRGVDLPGHSIGCCCSNDNHPTAPRPRFELEQAPSPPAERFIWWFEKEWHNTTDDLGGFNLFLPPYGLKLGLNGFPHNLEAAVLLCCYIGLDVSRAPELHTALSNLHSSLIVVDTAPSNIFTGKDGVVRGLLNCLDVVLGGLTCFVFNFLCTMIFCVCLCGDRTDPLERPYKKVIKSHQDSFCPLGVRIAIEFCVLGPRNLDGSQWRGPGIIFESLPG